MVRCEVYFYTDGERDEVHVQSIQFNQVPQIGWELRIPEVKEQYERTTQRTTNGIGVVFKVVMCSGDRLPQVFVHGAVRGARLSN